MTIETPVNTYWWGDGDGSNVTFTFPFSKFEDDDVFVYVYNTTSGEYDLKTAGTHYNISGATISFTAGNEPPTPPSTGYGNVLILRKTDMQTGKASFTAGSSIRAQDLDNNFVQSMRADQEFRDQKVDKWNPEVWANLDMKKRRVVNLEDPVNDQDAATRAYIEARRTNTLVQDTTPTAEESVEGLHWLKYAGTENQVHYIYDGTAWNEVASGIPFTPLSGTKVRYVDTKNGNDNAGNDGFYSNNPLKTIKRAVTLVNADPAGDGSLIWVNAGIYQEVLPITIQKDNVSIVGTTQRSCFVHPTPATETNVMFEVDSGAYLANMTFCGLKAAGTRGGYSLDPDSTYGLPTDQGWCVAFRNGAHVKKSPYVQNCVAYCDSGIDNTTTVYNSDNSIASGFDPDNMAGTGGDVTSGPTGGGILIDGSQVSSTSPLRSMVVDTYTQINLDGPGVLCANNGYGQLVSFFGTFCHYHAKAITGGQLNLSNCVTDFGRYGLIADGKSSSSIGTSTVVGAHSAGATSITVTAPVKTAAWHGAAVIPRTTQVFQIGSDTYAIKSSAIDSNGNYVIQIYNPNPSNISQNLGLTTSVSNGASVDYFQKSLIVTGGHVFEYCGSGTDYRAHPDNGGVPNINNQAVEIGVGQVWLSSTDENGRFVVGSGGPDSFLVDQLSGTVTLPSGAVISTNLVTDTTPQLGGDLDTNNFKIVSTANNNITLDPAGTGNIVMAGPVLFDSNQPTASTSTPGIVALSNTISNSTTTAATPAALQTVVPTGSVIMYAGSSAPSGYLEMAGQTVPNGSGTISGVTADFSSLYSVVGSTIPDMRGMFARGWDNGRDKDTGRAIRSDQADEIAAHTHAISDAGTHNHTLNTAGDHSHTIDQVILTGSFYPKGHNTRGTGVFTSTKVGDTESSDSSNGDIIEFDASHAHTMQDAGDHTHTVGDAGVHTHSISQTGGSETRPENVALMYCIKY
jgi:hypothetical protein